MTFKVSAAAYGQFMGRFSEPLAAPFADAAGIAAGQHVLDVGCGPGALAAELVRRVGADEVAAIDPQPTFVDAVRDRLPGVDVAVGSAENLEYPDATFDAAMAQLVVQFMTDPVAGLREMARVTRAGGAVAACIWDHASRRGPISTFWEAARAVDPGNAGEQLLAGVEKGSLAELFRTAGIGEITETDLDVVVRFDTFDEWWTPYTYGVGPAGEYLAGLDDAGRERVRAACLELIPTAPFSIDATAWCVVGRV